MSEEQHKSWEAVIDYCKEVEKDLRAALGDLY
jgi:hypothetical protein